MPEIALADPAGPDRSVAHAMPRWIMWTVGGAFILLFALRDYCDSSGGVISHSAYWGRDFINVWGGGQLIRAGAISTLTDLHAYAAFQRHLFGDIGPHNYSYPPVSYPLAALLSMLPYPLALASWTIGTGALFWRAARPWWPAAAGPAWLAVLTPAALVNVWAGHYGFLIGALFLFGWRNVDANPWRAGLFFGLMLVKPHLAVLVPIALVARGSWRAVAGAGLTAIALVAVTSWWFGIQPWIDFLFRTGSLQASLIDAGAQFFHIMSTSVTTAVLELTGSWALAIVLQAGVSAAAIAMVWVAAIRRVPTRDLALLTATATFLVLPYAFNYDLTVVMLGALVAMTRDEATAGQRRLAIYGFLAPQFGMVAAGMQVPLMPVMLAGLAVAQFDQCCPGVLRLPFARTAAPVAA